MGIKLKEFTVVLRATSRPLIAKHCTMFYAPEGTRPIHLLEMACDDDYVMSECDNDTSKVMIMNEDEEIVAGWDDEEIQTREDFIDYLRDTLIPDLKDSHHDQTAKDFETAIKFMEET
jgi:hypothetical protein